MPESRAALPEYFLVRCRVDQSLLTGYPQRDHLDHLRDRRLVLATLRGIKRPVQMIRAGIPAARHNRNACMSTAPPGRIGVKSTENLKVPNPAV